MDRPARTEVVAVVAACLLLFVLIVKLDRAGADRANARAARAAAAHVHRAVPAAARTPAAPRSLGDRGAISVPVGGAWSAGTAGDPAPRAGRTSSGAS